MIYEARIKGTPTTTLDLNARRLRRTVSASVIQAAPLAVQSKRRRKMNVRQKCNFQADALIRHHKERLVDEGFKFDIEQEAALSACFAALEAEDPVGKIGEVKPRVPGTIQLNELCMALRSLGYSARDEAEVLEIARADLTAKQSPHAMSLPPIGLHDFMRYMAIGPKPATCIRHLSSIGRVIAAVRTEVGVQEADHSAGRQVVLSEQKNTEARIEELNEMASEAYPFSIVTDAHRISNLVDSYVNPKSAPSPSKHIKSNVSHGGGHAGGASRGSSRLSSRLSSRGASRRPRDSREVYGTRTVSAGTFHQPDELLEWLQHMGIDTSGWGSGSAKAVDELHAEISKGETTLRMLEGKVFRCLSVVKLVVRESAASLSTDGGPRVGRHRHLVCTRQRMADGRTRERNQLPSEKLLNEEDPVLAAERAVREELGSVIGSTLHGKGLELEVLLRDATGPDAIQASPETMLAWDEVTDSPSFPGLVTQYRLHEVQILVRGLPTENFSSVEGTKEHFWEWRFDSDDDLRRKQPSADGDGS